MSDMDVRTVLGHSVCDVQSSGRREHSGALALK